MTRICCAVALAAGLAACENGDGGDGEESGPGPATMAERDAARERALGLADALEAARATGADGAFDDAAWMVAPIVAAAHDGMAATIAVTETGTPQGGSARAGELAADDDGPYPIDGWHGARFGRGEGAETLAVYSDVGAPVAMPFVPENLNRLSEVSGLTGETVPASGLAIEAGWFPVVRSTDMDVEAAPENSATTYRAEGTGANVGLDFAGTFGGGTGTYRCAGSACSVTLDDSGTPTAMAGDWFFAPDTAATVQVPDYDHLHFGWWLLETGDVRGFQSFAGAAGYAPGSGNVEAAMEGTATWRGGAAGMWTMVDTAGGRIADARTGEFTAEAVLTANFFGALDAGVASGEIGAFRDGAGRPLTGWRVELENARLAAGSASFAGETGGELGPGSSGRGHWQGRFHGSDGAETNARPSGVTGRFDLHFPGAHIAGAFGAGR